MAGLAAAFGSGAATNPIHDVVNADVVLITGSNITENHPVLAAALKRAVKFGRPDGKRTRLIVSDPRKVGIVRHADIWMRPTPGTDVAWINGIAHVILRENLHDAEYVAARTEEFETFRASVASFTPEHVQAVTGIPAAQVEEAARLYASGRALIFYCMGMTQHVSGTDNVKALANLAMLCGNIGRAGGGLNPIRGQNNVQGACDMGGLPDKLPGYRNVADAAAREAVGAVWGTTLPEGRGMTSRDMFHAMEKGTLKALYLVGENPMVSHADLGHAERCFDALDFLVVQDIFLTETARRADVVLPSACFAEKDGTFTNTERRVQRVRKAVDAPGEALADWRIVCALAERMGATWQFRSPQDVMREIAAVTPSYAGISHGRIEEEGIHWPCPHDEHEGTPILHTQGFLRGKGRFHAVSFVPPAELPDADYPFILTTGRVLYQYHTGTMTRKAKGLAAKEAECFVELAREDALRLGIGQRMDVRVTSRRGSIVVKARISPKAVAGTVFIPFHFAEAAANRLTHDASDPASGISEFKVCAVRVEPAV